MATVNGTTLTDTVTGLSAGTHTVTVTALNAIGESVASNTQSFVVAGSATLPGAPTNVTATAGTNQATISFSPPASNGGATITSYIVTSAGQAVATVSGTSSPITVTGLASGTYTFSVKSVNSAGQGPASSSTSAITVTSAVSVPGAPTNVSATPGTNSAVVYFTAPASNGGSAITTYTVVSSGQAVAVANGSGSPISLTNLAAGNYTFTVTATNSAGSGAASSPSSSITVSGPVVVNTVPSAPTNVSATGGQTQATVSWGAPSNNGGATVTSYTITSSGPTVKSVSATGTSTTVTGLTAGTYTFAVSATNSVGTGSSATSSSITVTGSTSGNTATNLLPATVAAVALAPSAYTSGGTNNTPTLAATTAVSAAVSGSSVIQATMATGTICWFQPAPIAANCAPVTAGTTYTALTYYRPTSSGVSCSAQIMWYDTNFNVISYSKGTVTPVAANTWTVLTASAAAPTGAVWATIQATIDISAAGAVVYVSNYEVAASTTVNTWTAGQGTIATVPGAPTIGTVTPGSGQATVAFTPPSNNGGSAITGYTVTATSQ